MSSDQNNSQERRMSSINRRLNGAWLGERLGRLFLSVLLLLVLVPAAYLGVREAAQFGGISRKTERDFAVQRDGSTAR